MKIRTGLVSNSSTSSFCVLGCEVTDKIIETATAAYNKEIAEMEVYICCEKCGYEPLSNPKFCEKCGGAIVKKERPVESGIDLYDVFYEQGLSYYADTDDDGDVVGLSIKGKTPKEILKLEEKLIELFGEGYFRILSGTYAC